MLPSKGTFYFTVLCSFFRDAEILFIIRTVSRILSKLIKNVLIFQTGYMVHY